MIWNNMDQELLFSTSENQFKNISKQNSTMMSSNIQLEEENEFKKLLVETQSFKEKEDFLSDNNSLFDLHFDESKTPGAMTPKEPLFFKFNEDQSDEEQNLTQTNDLMSSSLKKKKKIQKISQCCKCKNSNCLRLHCSCFKELGHCGPSCRCRNCLNTKEYQDAREFVINKTKTIYRKAFEQKHVLINEVKINKDGCNCSKNCENNYCGCKKING